jgi:PTS system nitrogen regulatory IIA component
VKSVKEPLGRDNRQRKSVGGFFVRAAIMERCMECRIFSDFVVEEAILPALQVTSKEAAIRAMVESLKNSGSIRADDEETLISRILSGEEHGSTGIGNGIAVPYTSHSPLDSQIATVALVKDGVEFDSLDGKPADIIFLLITPGDRPGDYLEMHETIGTHLYNQNFCSLLRQAKTRDAVMDILRKADAAQLD